MQRQGLHRDTAAQRRSGDLVIGSSGERAPSPKLRVANKDLRKDGESKSPSFAECAIGSGTQEILLAQSTLEMGHPRNIEDRPNFPDGIGLVRMHTSQRWVRVPRCRPRRKSSLRSPVCASSRKNIFQFRWKLIPQQHRSSERLLRGVLSRKILPQPILL